MAVKTTLKASLKNEKGLALIETLPMIFIFLLLLAYGIGFFGIIHTGTLNTIAARTYAFETFRNRTDLTYFRHETLEFSKLGHRFHAIASETSVETSAGGDRFTASERPLAIGVDPSERGRADIALHNARVFEITEGQRNTSHSTSPVWIMTGYGICLDLACGD